MLVTLAWVAMVLIITSAHMFLYYKGRIDERALWEPRWQMESTEYRLMPYGIDN